ncbi:hypothetical protein J3B02_006154 [Coemansia erecta]|uniref:LITAF domain-containing protein n=1 Tax=Coemansia asiatica TaxID=1052880 RepID=A0A9W8CI78_9FUNG|nr:hypothetical protein LPJ64_005290 [Coemansia asiatica]KAJ2840915.1 hypothetical protein J3B02_006154 [Coemansia erecta]
MSEKARQAEIEKEQVSGYNNPNPLPPGTLPPASYPDDSAAYNSHRQSVQSTDLYDDAPVSRGNANAQSPYQAPNGPYGQPQPPATGPQAGPQAGPQSGPSPYGPYGDSNPPVYQPDAPPVSHSKGSPQQQTVVVDGVEGMNLPPDSYIEVTDVPANVKCPNCHKDIVTQIKTKTGARTVVAAAAIFVVFWPLAFIPFMSKRLKKQIHVCPYCKHKLGKVISLTAVKPVSSH